MSQHAHRRQGWMWGVLLVGSLATAIYAFGEWVSRGDADPAPAPLALDQPGMPFGPAPEDEAPAQPPLPEGFAPDLPAVPTLPPGKRASIPAAEAGDEDARLAALEAEMRLVNEARTMLTTEPGVALSLLDQHRQRFPQGALREEREAFAIEALAALGRTDEVERRYVEFREDFPGSAHAERLARILD